MPSIAGRPPGHAALPTARQGRHPHQSGSVSAGRRPQRRGSGAAQEVVEPGSPSAVRRPRRVIANGPSGVGVTPVAAITAWVSTPISYASWCPTTMTPRRGVAEAADRTVELAAAPAQVPGHRGTIRVTSGIGEASGRSRLSLDEGGAEGVEIGHHRVDVDARRTRSFMLTMTETRSGRSARAGSS